MGSEYSDQRSAESKSSATFGKRGGQRAGDIAPGVFATVVRADDDGRAYFTSGVRQRRQPVVGTLCCAKTRNCTAIEHRRRPSAHRPATDDRKCFAGVSERYWWRAVRHMGNSLSHSSAGQRPEQLHAASGTKLACARGDGRAFSADGRDIRARAGTAGHSSGRSAFVEGNARNAGHSTTRASATWPRAGAGGKPDCDLHADACGGGTLCQNAFESGIDPIGIQSRTCLVVSAECAEGRAQGTRTLRVLRRPAPAVWRDSRRPYGDTVGRFNSRRRKRTSSHGGRHASESRDAYLECGTKLLSHDADSDAGRA